MNSRRMSQSALRRFPAATRQLLAAMRRQDVAMGASPWTASPQLAFSPEGTTGASIHFAPLGLRTRRLPCFHGLAFNHGLAPIATTCRPVGTFGELPSSLPAATRRQDVAMGASPWTASPQLAFSPEGTTGASFHAAPWGLRTGRLPRFHGLTPNHGLAPMATTCRPVGTQYGIRCAESAKLEKAIKKNLKGLGYGD
jgi:hypothetical protein